MFKNYSLDDLKSEFNKRPRYVSFQKQQKIFKNRIQSDNDINDTLESKFFNKLNFTSTTSNLFKPIIDSQKKTTELLKQSITENKNNLSIEYKEKEPAIVKTPEIEEIDKTKFMVNRYLSNDNSDQLFGIVEFKDDTISFGCIDEIIEYDFLIDLHEFEFDYEIKKIYLKRKDGEKRDFNLTENLMRYLTLDIVDINDENAKKDYLDIIDYAIGPELQKIKRANKSNNRKEILNKFRSNKKFVELIAPKFGIKKLSYDDKLVAGDGLGHTRRIVIPSNTNDKIKRLMVLLGSKKSLGTKDSYDLGLEEFTAILDELLKSQKIDKLTYKTFLQKYYKE